MILKVRPIKPKPTTQQEMANDKEISFGALWNSRKPDVSKLDLSCFSTIRIQSYKYNVGEVYAITFKRGKEVIIKGVAELKSITPFLLQNLTEGMALLDTGYSKEKTTQIIKKMYPKVNFDSQKLVFLVLKYVNNAQ